MIYESDEFIGIVDLIKSKALYYKGEFGENVIEKNIPDNFKKDAVKYRDNLIEKRIRKD